MTKKDDALAKMTGADETEDPLAKFERTAGQLVGKLRKTLDEIACELPEQRRRTDDLAERLEKLERQRDETPGHVPERWSAEHAITHDAPLILM